MLPRILAAAFPFFPLQVALRAAPGLTGQAFAVADGISPNSDLVSVSKKAWDRGARPGATVTQGKAMCPSLLVRARSAAAEEGARIAVGEVLAGFGPRVEVAPDGTAGWVDLTGVQAGDERALASDAVLRLNEAGFRARTAVAGSRFAARALAEQGADSPPRGADGEALRALPVFALAQGVRDDDRRAVEQALEAFRRLGLTTLGQVATLPADTLARRFGPGALRLSALARGDDPSPLRPFRLPEALFERIELAGSTESLEMLLFPLKTLLDRICARLRGRGRQASKLALHLVLERGPGLEIEIRLPKPTAVARTILEVAREGLSRVRVQEPIVEIAADLLEMVDSRRTQLALFDEMDRPVDPKRSPPSPDAIIATLGRLATVLGEQAVFTAEVADEHRPEHASRRGQALLEGPSTETADLPEAVRPTRLLPEPTPVVFASKDEVVALGERRRVLSISGPERLFDGWWAADRTRDYYLVKTEEGGTLWIFRDTEDAWWLHGLFD